MSFQPPTESMREQLNNSRLWRDSQGKAGQRFYMAFEEYRQLDLADVTMYDGTLQEAKLTGVRLDRADLGRVLANGLCLDDSQCIATCFDKAMLVEASFVRVIGRQATFWKANLKSATFAEADIREAIFDGATCMRASFRNADLRAARMRGALLTGADFTGSLLSGVDWTGAVLDATTRLAPADGIEQIIAHHLNVNGRPVEELQVGAALAALAGNGLDL